MPQLVLFDALLYAHSLSIGLPLAGPGSCLPVASAFPGLFDQRGLREKYDVMISYRQAANSEFAGKLHDSLCMVTLQLAQRPLAVFFDQVQVPIASPQMS
jgi:hypothetical protein